MNELQRALMEDSAAAPPRRILEGLDEQLARSLLPNTPHSIYEELWHITSWQDMTLEWVNGVETPFPLHAADGFPGVVDVAREPWDALCGRFLRGNGLAAEMAGKVERLDHGYAAQRRRGTLFVR